MEIGIPKIYDPKSVELKLYSKWEEGGYFHPSPEPGKPYYCITIPPPNVTGSLHMGHALNHSIMDSLIRWKRMQGINTLCLPGTDHAGIATQNVVEKELRKQGITRHDLGREKFVEKVWEWVDQYGNTILLQLKRLGCSYDWKRLRFTLDEKYADAVLEVFVRWWNDGLLYLGNRVVNWCPHCMSVISDIEVANEEKNGHLWHIKYPFKDNSGFIVVATTRPETMLGDVAVAVNPKDERYRDIIGKTIILPLVGREIPLIADEYPDPEFGSGAVKITPAHDANDYEVGKRHELPMPVIMSKSAHIDTDALRKEIGQENNDLLKSYDGLERYKAREKIVKDLQDQGFLENIEPHKLVIGHCDRCRTIIEPLLCEQWFADMSEISKPAIDAVKEGKIRFIPERYKQLYLNWMENLRDWPISRQLWWGHQIPAYYCLDCHPEDFEQVNGEWQILRRRNPIVSKEPVTACPVCNSNRIMRGPWVLDTWFSSAIWPQTTLGWPEETADLEYYFPTSLLTTAAEILYLWVARMIMTSLYFTDKIPFEDVYIHATVLDAQGRRMSKSKGTGIDPLDLIDKYGADATRFSLLQQAGDNQDIRFSEQRVEIARNFSNKIWNASRFVMMNLDEPFYQQYQHELPDKELLTDIDRWIISRLQHAAADVNRALTEYRMDEAARTIYEFVWNEYCDWYIEAVKQRLNEPETRYSAQAVLVWVLEQSLRLIHPFMPFITEEIWLALPHNGETLLMAEYPQSNPLLIDDSAEAGMNMLMDVTRAVRNLRAEVGVTPGQKTEIVYIVPTDNEYQEPIKRGLSLIAGFSWTTNAVLGKPAAGVKSIESCTTYADIFLPIDGSLDVEKESARLRKELEKMDVELKRVQNKLRNPQFVERAPADIVEKERALENELTERVMKINERLKLFS